MIRKAVLYMFILTLGICCGYLMNKAYAEPNQCKKDCGAQQMACDAKCENISCQAECQYRRLECKKECEHL